MKYENLEPVRNISSDIKKKEELLEELEGSLTVSIQDREKGFFILHISDREDFSPFAEEMVAKIKKNIQDRIEILKNQLEEL